MINYGITIKSINTLMYMVWHVDKYKITFKLVINWTNEILQHIAVSSGLSRPGIIDARAQYRAAARRLRNTALKYQKPFVICGFRCKVGEIRALLGYNSAYYGNSLLTFWHNLSFP